jgi:DNA-binding response OmpR family regulator
MAENKKILIVDDEPDIVEGFVTFFEDNGYTTISAADGRRAFELAKSDKPDLITLDITMDEESGMRALANLQHTDETSSIPIIIITGVSTDLKRFIERSKQVKMPEAFMEKPVDRDELLKRVKSLIG